MVAQIDSFYIRTRPAKVVPRIIGYSLFEGRPLTTRGRWINPLVFTHFAIEKRLPILKEVKKPVFIVGTGRSGSTVLGVLMSMHRDIGLLNEPKALWHAAFPEEDVIGNYSRGPARYRLDESDATAEVRRRMHRLFGAYLRISGSKRVVDKYPELVFRIPFVRAVFPDARFVFLVRNGWDTCGSIEGWSRRLGVSYDGESHDWWGVDNRKWRLILEQLVPEEDDLVDALAGITRHTDMAAVEWIVTMREGLRQMERNPGCVHLLRYESLVESPRQELAKLLQFCDLPSDEVFLSYAEHKLVPPRSTGEFDLHPALIPPFKDTMSALGY